MTEETGTVSSVAFGGEGVVRDLKKVVFVPFVAPNEEIRFKIKEEKKSFSRGRLLAVIKPSPDRIEPLCPYFTVCGGCQLQHINYPAQLQIKKQIIEDTLLRIGGVAAQVEVSPSKKVYGYRRSISLRFDDGALSYTSIDYERMPVDICPIFFENDSQKWFLEATTLLLGFPDCRVVFFKKSRDQVALCIHAEKLSSHHIQDLKARFEKGSDFVSCFIKTPKETYMWGEKAFSAELFGLNFQLSPFSFNQNHPEQMEEMYRYVANEVQGAKSLLDLYSGPGVLTLFLNQEIDAVHGVDFNLDGIKVARENAKALNFPKAAFTCSKVEDATLNLLKKFKPDTVVVNPPREGIDAAVLQRLGQSDVKKMVYISCMPSTLSRDVKLLLTLGFKVQKVQGFDLFPQTTHVETVVTFVKD